MEPTDIIDALSIKIAKAMRQKALEEFHPTMDADASDDYIKAKAEFIAKARDIRLQLEELFFTTVE